MDTGRSIIIASVALVLGGGVAAYAVMPRYTLTNPGTGVTVRLDRRSGDMIGCQGFDCQPLVKGDKIASREIPPPPPGFVLDTPQSRSQP